MLMRRHARPPTPTPASLSRTDPPHTLPLTTWLALCRADRSLAWTSILLAKNFYIMRCGAHRSGRAVREAACLVGMLEHIGKVRQNQRGAAEATVPRLCACDVRCVARAARGLSAHIREDTPPWRRFER